MQPVRRPVVARQEEQAEGHLGHDQRLREREQVGEEAARLAAAKAKAAQRPALEKALPADLGMPQILDQLNAMALQAKVTLDSVRP